ncbi:MAG: glycosyltransferase family 4 protein [Caldilineaceae bacterium]|nr:glycosyltransferase family 4 protein [Caldilineaceae bacterium]
MPTILFNDNLISVRAQRGIARYFGEIVAGAGRLLGADAAVCSPEPWRYGDAHHIPSLRFKGSWRIGLQDKIATAAALALRPAVIFNAYYGDVNSRAAQAYTVYDMLHELTAPPDHPFIAQKRRCLHRAAALFPISYHSANDLVRCYPDLDRAKIHPIPLGVDASFFAPAGARSPAAGKPYFLYVGHRTPYKNFMRLLEAFGQTGLAREFDLRVISPVGSFTDEERACMAQYDMVDSVALSVSPSDATLRQAYAGAYAFVYPSVYEGFGLPILEAFASRTLVCTSNVSSMPELGGEVALYFAPEAVESIAACLVRTAAMTAAERLSRIDAGAARARFFTWERCVTQTIDVLRSLAAPGGA